MKTPNQMLALWPNINSNIRDGNWENVKFMKAVFPPLKTDQDDIVLRDTLSRKARERSIGKKIKSRFEFLEWNDYPLIQKIENVIKELICENNEFPDVNNSVYISEKLNKNYSYLSNKFSRIKRITIEHYIINLKIELVKTMLVDGFYNLTEISYKLHYSSLAHLCNQFKKVTGLSPSEYRKLKQMRIKGDFGIDLADEPKEFILRYDWDNIQDEINNFNFKAFENNHHDAFDVARRN